jgi:hypothetical protein
VLGAPRARAGVASPSTVLTDLGRDSVATGVMFTSQAKANERGLTPDERAELRLHQAPGLSPTGRAARLPGEPMYAPMMNGGASIAYAPIAKALPRDTRREDSLNAEFRARYERLQERILRRRDSLRTDSLRRDSLAKARIHP